MVTTAAAGGNDAEGLVVAGGPSLFPHPSHRLGRSSWTFLLPFKRDGGAELTPIAHSPALGHPRCPGQSGHGNRHSTRPPRSAKSLSATPGKHQGSV